LEEGKKTGAKPALENVMARPKKSTCAMPVFTLSAQEREVAETLVSHRDLTPEVRRAQALLWLDAGHSPQTIAQRLRVSRQTVYNWLVGFQRRNHLLDLRVRLADKPRCGRPRTVPKAIDPLLTAIVTHEPREFGYRAPVWNTSLLGRYLREVQHIAVNRASVGIALRRLGIRLKVLALRPAEREELARVVARTDLTKETRWAQALLWLDEGVSVRKVAARLQTSRQTVYNWIGQFQAQCGERELRVLAAKDYYEGSSQMLSPEREPFPIGTIEHRP
jgi:transposase